MMLFLMQYLMECKVLREIAAAIGIAQKVQLLAGIHPYSTAHFRGLIFEGETLK